MGAWSVVRNESIRGFPCWTCEVRGGRSNGGRYIQYTPENGILTDLAREISGDMRRQENEGVTRTGVAGLFSGKRITPGKLSSVISELALPTGGRYRFVAGSFGRSP